MDSPKEKHHPNDKNNNVKLKHENLEHDRESQIKLNALIKKNTELFEQKRDVEVSMAVMEKKFQDEIASKNEKITEIESESLHKLKLAEEQIVSLRFKIESVTSDKDKLEKKLDKSEIKNQNLLAKSSNLVIEFDQLNEKVAEFKRFSKDFSRSVGQCKVALPEMDINEKFQKCIETEAGETEAGKSLDPISTLRHTIWQSDKEKLQIENTRLKKAEINLEKQVEDLKEKFEKVRKVAIKYRDGNADLRSKNEKLEKEMIEMNSNSELQVDRKVKSTEDMEVGNSEEPEASSPSPRRKRRHSTRQSP